MYGGVAFGGTDRPIAGKWEYEESHDRFRLAFDFVVSATSDANFTTECSLVENAVRAPFQDLIVNFAGQEHQDLRESTMRGLNTQGRIVKSSSQPAARRARVYEVTFEGELPADRASLFGRRQSIVAVAYSHNRRRTVTITGIWTALPTTSTARTAYLDATNGMPAYANTVLTNLGGAYELDEETFDLDDADLGTLAGGSVLRFRRVYEELIYPQGGVAASAPLASQTSIVRQRLRVTRHRSGVGDTAPARRLETYLVSYDCSVDNEVTSATLANFSALWTDTIRPSIISDVGVLMTGSAMVIESSPNYDLDESRISATMTIQGRSGSPIIERRVTIEDHDIGGFIAVPVWDGKKRSRYVFDAPLFRQRVITETARAVIDVKGQNQLDAIPAMGAGILGSLGGRIIERHSTITPITLGRTDIGGELQTVEITGRMVVEIFDETDGARLAVGALADAGASPFLFDVDQGLFDLRSGGGALFNRNLGFFDQR